MLVTLTYLFFINFHRKKTKSSGGVGYQYKGIYIRRQPFLEKANFACLKCFKYRRPRGGSVSIKPFLSKLLEDQNNARQKIFVMNLLDVANVLKSDTFKQISLDLCYARG